MQDLSVHSEYIDFLKFQDCFKDRANLFVNLLQVYHAHFKYSHLEAIRMYFQFTCCAQGCARFLKYFRPFYNMYERVKVSSSCSILIHDFL